MLTLRLGNGMKQFVLTGFGDQRKAAIKAYPHVDLQREAVRQ